ncbi:hypothetical protein BJ165DRAFT_1524158 [Panaeolus papilionaceus]|nr:hypothetical protein BJ165DRAFT_1524158 [Panaeolus papilionaceus]
MPQTYLSDADHAECSDNSLFGQQHGGGRSTDKSKHQVAAPDDPKRSEPSTPGRVLRPIVHHTPKYADMNGVGVTDRKVPKPKPKADGIRKGGASPKSKGKTLEKVPKAPTQKPKQLRALACHRLFTCQPHIFRAPSKSKPSALESKKETRPESPSPKPRGKNKAPDLVAKSSKSKSSAQVANSSKEKKKLASRKDTKKHASDKRKKVSRHSILDSDSSSLDTGSDTDAESDAESTSTSGSDSDSDPDSDLDSGSDSDVFGNGGEGSLSSSSEEGSESSSSEEEIMTDALKTKGATERVPIDKAEPPARGVGGRPSAARKAELESGIEELCQLLTRVVKKSGFKPDRVIDAFLERNGRGMNPWNTYQQYLQVPAHREEEMKRLPEAERVKEGDIIPTQLVGRMYELFKVQTQDQGQILLTKFRESLDLEDSNVTFRIRDDGFQNWCARVQKIMKEGGDNWSFDSLFIACGRVVNQDQSLCEILYGGMGDEFFSKHFDIPESVIQGHFRTHVYLAASKSSAEAVGKKIMAAAPLSKKDPEQPKEEEEDSSNQEEEPESNVARKQQNAKLRASLDILLEPLKLSVGQRWKGLPNALASKRHTLVNWPHDVGFPFETTKKKGIAGLTNEARKAWLAAIDDKKAPLKLVPWPRDGTSKNTPVIQLCPGTLNAPLVCLFKDETVWLGGIQGMQVQRGDDNQWKPVPAKSIPDKPAQKKDDNKKRSKSQECSGSEIGNGNSDHESPAPYTPPKKKVKISDVLETRKSPVDTQVNNHPAIQETPSNAPCSDADRPDEHNVKEVSEVHENVVNTSKEKGGGDGVRGRNDDHDHDSARPAKRPKKELDDKAQEKTKKKDKKKHRASDDKTRKERKKDKAKSKKSKSERVAEAESEDEPDAADSGNVFQDNSKAEVEKGNQAGVTTLFPPTLQLEEPSPDHHDPRFRQGLQGSINQYSYQYAAPPARFGGQEEEGKTASRKLLGPGYPESHSRSHMGNPTLTDPTHRNHLVPVDCRYSHARQYSADRPSQPPYSQSLGGPLPAPYTNSLPGSRQVSQEYHRNGRQLSPAVGHNFNNAGNSDSNGDNLLMTPSTYNSSWSSLPSMSPNPSLDMQSPRWNNLQPALPDNPSNSSPPFDAVANSHHVSQLHMPLQQQQYQHQHLHHQRPQPRQHEAVDEQFRARGDQLNMNTQHRLPSQDPTYGPDIGLRLSNGNWYV